MRTSSSTSLTLPSGCPAARMSWTGVAVIGLGCLLVGCGPVPDDGVGLLGTGLADPFPSVFQLDHEGFVRLRGLPPVQLSEVPIDDSSWRRGFSPAQVAVARIEGLDPESLPSWWAPTPGEGAVRLADLTEGIWLPVMAELDANARPAEADLLIRPLVTLPPGHRIAVVVTTQGAPRPERFDALLSRRPPSSLADVQDHFDGLVGELVDLGLRESEIAIAWDFPIEDGLKPTRSAVELVSSFEPVISWSDLREDSEADAGGWRSASGSFTVPSVLDERGRLRLTDQGEVVANGVVSFDLRVHVPQSVRGAEPGTVPVVVFGHGIFGSTDIYLGGSSPNAVHRFAEDAGAIVVATRFTGLSRPDLALALSVANDLTRMPELTEQLVQAQVGLRGLVELVDRGELTQEPPFLNDEGASLALDSEPLYYGISLGGIQGAVAIELGLPVQAGVLHVGGSMWSTMLERSSNFVTFDGIVSNIVPDPGDRARLIAWTQLHWDLVDPFNGAPDLGRVPVLLQEALYDEQVPNQTTRALARSAGLTAVGPLVEEPWGLERAEAPFSTGGAYTQFDPELEGSPDINRPAVETGAHGRPRNWAGVRAQTVHFLDPATLGQVVHRCGPTPCSNTNRGE